MKLKNVWYSGVLPEDVLKFHYKCLLIDLHVDSLLIAKITRIDLCRQHIYFFPRGALCFHADVPRFRLGNVGAAFLGLVPYPFGKNAGHINKMIEIAEKTTQRLPSACTMARSAEDVLRAKRDRKTAFILGIEGATSIDGDPRRIRYFAKRGVRYFGLVHFNANFAAYPGIGLGSKADKKGEGLTPYGKIIIEECIRNGLIIDLAHISKPGFFKAIDLIPEKIPVIISHVGINKSHPHRRNIDDDQVRAIAGTGGVIGIINASTFLGGNTLKDYIRHVIAARDIAGYRHVAIGSDFDGMIIPVQGLEDVSRFPSLTAALLDEGLSRHEIAAILGENMLRVLKEVPPRYPFQIDDNLPKSR